MDTFDLCWDNTYSSKIDGMQGITSLRDLINQDLINHPNFYMPEFRFQIADISKKGGDTVALLFSSLSPSDVAKVRELAAKDPELYAGLADAVSIKAQLNGKPYVLSTLSPEILSGLPINADLYSLYTANPELFTELVRGRGNGDGDLVNVAYLAAGLAKDYNNLSTSARAAAMTTIASYFSQVGWSNEALALGPQISPDANRRWLAEIDTIAFALGRLPEEGRTALAQSFNQLKFGNPVLDPEFAMVLELIKAFNTELLVVGGGLSTFTTVVTAGTAPRLFAAGWAINDAIYAGRQYVTGEEITPGGQLFNGVLGGETAVGMGFAYSLSPAAGNLVTRGFLGVATVQVGREWTDWSSMTAQERNGVIYDTATLGVGYGFSRLGGVWGSTSAGDAAAGLGPMKDLGLKTAKIGDSFLDSTTAAGDTIYHGTFSTAIGDDTATLNNFNKAVNTGDGHNVIVHGALSYDELGGIPYVNGSPTNPAQIAEAVRNNPNYVEGTQVCFASCWSGSSGTAQQFANELRAPVFAPNRPVAWDTSVGKWVFDTDMFPSGTTLPYPNIKPGWQMFYPTQ